MYTRPIKSMSFLGGVLLIVLGILLLVGEFFERFDFWGTFWPFILICIGLAFFAAMQAGGKSAASLAIPGSILACLGLMMFLQNLFDHWESWSYGWTVIIFSVGLGIYIKGAYAGQETSRRSGIRLMRLGGILFIIFGIFFESIFSFGNTTRYLFPIAMIVLGLYLLVTRSGLLSTRRDEIPTAPQVPLQAEAPAETETPSDQQ